MFVFQCVLHSDQCLNLFDRLELAANKEFKHWKKCCLLWNMFISWWILFLNQIYFLAMLVLLRNLLQKLCSRLNDALTLLQNLLLDLCLHSDDALAFLQNLLLDFHLHLDDAFALLQSLLLDLCLHSDDALTLLQNLLLDFHLHFDNAFALLKDLLLDLRLCIKLHSHFIVILALEIDALFSWNWWILVN